MGFVIDSDGVWCARVESSRGGVPTRRVRRGGFSAALCGRPSRRTNERTNASSSSWEMDLEDTKDDGEENIYID
jgi:hypothetical protein